MDTNTAADFICRRRGVFERAKATRSTGAQIGIGLPVLAELYAGVEWSQNREKNLEILERNLQVLRVWPFTREAARDYGLLYTLLRRQGKTIQHNDLQIAAIARTLGHCTIVSTDSDVSGIPGLSVENWSQDPGIKSAQ